MAATGGHPCVPAGTLETGDPALPGLAMAQAAERYGVPGDTIPKRRRGAGNVSSAEMEGLRL